MTTVPCKNCQQMCSVKVSQSEKNKGKKYYACPKSCQGVFNGWAEADDKSNSTSSTSSTFRKPFAPQIPTDSAECPQCNSSCIARVSNTEKNRGKKFWACPKSCKGWIGWAINDDNDLDGDLSPVAPSVPVPVPVSGPVASVSTKRPAIVYSCSECDKDIDVEYEVNVYAKKHKQNATDIRTELVESITGGDYKCDQCCK